MNMLSRSWKWAKNHPIWSKVVAILIGAAILGIIGHLTKLISFDSFWKWLVETLKVKHVIPFWKILLTAVLSFAAGNIVWVIAKIINRYPRWKHYTKDIIQGVLWQWEYLTGFEVWPERLSHLCPKCCRELIPQRFRSDLGDYGFELVCPNRDCRFESERFNYEPRALIALVKNEIEGKIRTGQYIKSMKRMKRIYRHLEVV